MKKLTLICSTFIVLLFVTACGNDAPIPADENIDTNLQTEIESRDAEPADDQEEINEAGEADEIASANGKARNDEDMQKMMEQLDFHEFELEVEYGNNQEYEVEIEHHSDGRVGAEVEDELQDVFISDDLDAFNYLFPFVSKLNVSKDMDKQAIIDHVLAVFELDVNYQEFEVEFEFKDGSELKIEDKR